MTLRAVPCELSIVTPLQIVAVLDVVAEDAGVPIDEAIERARVGIQEDDMRIEARGLARGPMGPSTRNP